ncbi:hypothetical protein KP509_14G079500 [Ceratopteris richardii]|uniref:Alpha/beta hydrolase fold-3 domain-containing protein n=1 Tax=Ceratopteris richardii TaxID=49495 RepID=A0A8T2TGP9_CERRI|nr:hypothetical protein KP509_14G079500 [Ceratopteris richardii]
MAENTVSRPRVLREVPGFIVLYEDGSTERSPLPTVPVSADFVDGVATKDVIINPRTGTWARIFLPQSVVGRGPTSSRTPLVLHFHSGGMCLGSPASVNTHRFCSRMASASSSIWISVYYRLAPEHRLPVQYQDCFESLCWLRAQFTSTEDPQDMPQISVPGQKPWEVKKVDFLSAEREPWVVHHGDATRVFCTGESAGATILHFMALEIVKRNCSPLNIKGLMYVDLGVLTDPLPEMTPSTDPAVTTKMMETFVALCLPVGAKLGDSVLDCLHPNSTGLFKLPWPPVLMLTAGRDLLRESGMRYFNSLKEAHKDVDIHDSAGKGHCFNLSEVDSEAAKLREKTMIQFMNKHCL